MWQNYIFGMHWKHRDKMYYDELSAESQEEAAGYFIDHARDDISLVRVELVRPDDGGVREFAKSPVSPFSPLRARLRMDAEDDAQKFILTYSVESNSIRANSCPFVSQHQNPPKLQQFTARQAVIPL